ncbi:hypothetical protein [Silvibacterium acidisoli]|uniref:hypothetical protein n=1 Tax=Acidobacteriaceae bacterium ZG23-2 TaxID=2883246 RepID=UPI00406D1585
MPISGMVFAVTMIGMGLVGIVNSDLMPVWNPVFGTGSAHKLLVEFGIGVSLVSGTGLLFSRSAAGAARLLLATLSVWVLLFRLPNFIRTSPFEACWTVFPLLVMISGSMVIYVWVAVEWDHEHVRWISTTNGLHVARALYGLALIFFGIAHLIDVPDTVSLVPRWLPSPLFLAYCNDFTFIAAGVAVLLFKRWAQLAAALSAIQIGSFLLLVWIPIVMRGSRVRFQWSETF